MCSKKVPLTRNFLVETCLPCNEVCEGEVIHPSIYSQLGVLSGWSFVTFLCIHSLTTLTRKICSNRADFLKSAGGNSPSPFTDFLKSATADLLKFAGRNSPPPQFADFLKSATPNLPPGTFTRKTFYPVGGNYLVTTRWLIVMLCCVSMLRNVFNKTRIKQ